ncbi:TetR/AcrR family transcriptional regulator [Glycomyces arizonensis]|uniref:TetR/AcrR family transcriptional regulator n=1 Tax=Glycomyces arizonensis TaxID=256035 RepID=UPI00041E83CE|nr:TetR/AcrR family transcriptional regulator [Glycomyces arizonensis]
MTADTFTAVLWPEDHGPRRGPKPALSKERIAAEAIALADNAGLEAVTMQRLADGLGCAKMALYRHVPGRGELIALMTDTALGTPPELDGDWRTGLRQWTEAAWRGFTPHPWLAYTAVGPRVFGPNELGWLEAALGALDGTGLGPDQRLDVVALLSGHVRALVLQAGGAYGTTEAEMIDANHGILAAHGDDFPLTVAAFGHTGTDNAFEFGLTCILEGVAARIADAG